MFASYRPTPVIIVNGFAVSSTIDMMIWPFSSVNVGFELRLNDDASALTLMIVELIAVVF